jgi:hypothetical protein
MYHLEIIKNCTLIPNKKMKKYDWGSILINSNFKIIKKKKQKVNRNPKK